MNHIRVHAPPPYREQDFMDQINAIKSQSWGVRDGVIALQMIDETIEFMKDGHWFKARVTALADEIAIDISKEDPRGIPIP